MRERQLNYNQAKEFRDWVKTANTCFSKIKDTKEFNGLSEERKRNLEDNFKIIRRDSERGIDPFQTYLATVGVWRELQNIWYSKRLSEQSGKVDSINYLSDLRSIVMKEGGWYQEAKKEPQTKSLVERAKKEIQKKKRRVNLKKLMKN
jgi:hypothetical protein